METNKGTDRDRRTGRYRTAQVEARKQLKRTLAKYVRAFEALKAAEAELGAAYRAAYDAYLDPYREIERLGFTSIWERERFSVVRRKDA